MIMMTRIIMTITMSVMMYTRIMKKKFDKDNEMKMIYDDEGPSGTCVHEVK